MICEYGCGQEAKYQFKNGKWCCSSNHAKCNKIKELQRSKSTGRKIQELKLINEKNKKCKYCNRSASYKTKNGIYCCSSNISKCRSNIKKQKKSYKKTSQKLQPINTNILCEYGCGKLAKFETKLGHVCCSEYISQCTNVRKINKERNLGRKHNKETLRKFRKIQSKNKLSISQIQNRYPLFAKIEEIRYEPGKEREKTIQVHCKNHNCINSKKQDGWFTPSKSSLNSRIYAIERINSTQSLASHFLYCSYKCKVSCSLFNIKKDPNDKIQKDNYIKDELIFKQEVLRRQRKELGNNECEICECREDLHIHHEKPRKTHPHMILDPDNGIILCKKCHYKYGHRDECSSAMLSHKECKQIINRMSERYYGKN